MNATAPAPDGPPQAVQAHPHTSKDTAMTITNERLAEIRDLSVDSCSADAPHNPDVWALEAARKDLLAEVDRLRAKLDAPCGSCHPCTNYADETWRAAGRTPPHVYVWDEVQAEVKQLREQRDRLLALHEYDELIFGGFYCVHCTPDDADDNVYWPCPSLRAVGVDNDEGNAIILARRAEIERKAAQEAGTR